MVPSLLHEIIVELFRSRGEIAAELLQRCGLTVAHTHAELGSIDLSQVAPAEYRADVVIILRDHDDRAVTGVIVEVQRQPDARKRLSWPVYVATLRATLTCPVVLLVVSPDASVAAWAREPIELGWPASCVTPVAIGFDDVPWIRDRTEALRSPELAVLSALAHPDLEVAAAAIHAVSELQGGQRQLYFDVVMAALPATIRHILETEMIEGYKYQSEFARRYYGAGETAGIEQGRAEGRADGLAEGRADGLAEGRVDGLRAAVLVLMRGKLDAVSEHDVAALETVHDQRVLTELLGALAQARDAAEARGALDRVLGDSQRPR